MAIPSFNAEASLHATGEQYRLAATRTNTGRQVITSQLPKWTKCAAALAAAAAACAGGADAACLAAVAVVADVCG
jgi:hypothetical protein